MSQSKCEIIYLDNAATTYPKPESVYHRADEFYRRTGANAGRGTHQLAMEAMELIWRTREKLALFAGVARPEWIVFLPSATAALNLAILGSDIQSGDVIFHSPFEHNAVWRPLKLLEKRRGVILEEIPVNPFTFEFDSAAFKRAVKREQPRMIVVSHASNVCGVISPIEEIAETAKTVGALCIVDGAQALGFVPLNLKQTEIDYYIFSGHKSLYGPFGVGGLLINTQEKLNPLILGGTGLYSELERMPENPPERYEAGSHNTWAIAGFEAGLDEVGLEIGSKQLFEHVNFLTTACVEELEQIDNVRFIGNPDAVKEGIGLFSFNIRGTSPQDVEEELDKRFKIAVRAGLHCAPIAHRWLGTFDNGGTVRVSFGLFNSKTNVELFCTALKELSK